MSNIISVEGNVFPTREGTKPSAKYWQPPPRIRLISGRFGLVDLTIDEAQSLYNQLQDSLAEAEREVIKRDQIQSGNKTV